MSEKKNKPPIPAHEPAHQTAFDFPENFPPALEEKDQLWFVMAEKAFDGVYIIQDGRFVFVNKKMAGYMGYTKDELIGQETESLIHPEDRASILASARGRLKGEIDAACEFRVLTKSGEDGWVREVITPIRWRGKTAILGHARDLTPEREAKDKLRQIEELSRTLLDNVDEGYVEVDLAGNFTRINETFREMSGYSREELIGMNYRHYTEEPDRDRIFKIYHSVYLTGAPAKWFDCEICRKDGQRRIVEVSAFLKKDSAGRPTGFRGVARDVTNRKEIENALQQSEERFAKAFQAGPVPSMITTMDEARVIDVNEAMLKMFSFRREQVIGHSAMGVWVDPEVRKAYMDIFRQKGSLREEPIQLRAKGGEIKDILWSAEMITLRDESVMLSLLYDMTDRKHAEVEKKELESRLQQAHKMEAIGTLAGGIAHDFNNILASIIGFTEMTLHRDLPPGSRARHNLEQVLNASGRARDLVHQILTFSRQQTQAQQSIQVVPIVKEVLKLLRASLPTTIDLRTIFSARDNAILADPVQIHQILMNLGSNAAHSMREKGGVLEIQLSNTELDAREAEQRHVRMGRYLKLSIRDTGHGIAPDILERIFDPFFTTKTKGEGTGLGLSVVYGIVKSCDGAISVRSKPGEGTVFDIYFPVLHESEQKVLGDREKSAAFSGGSETILYVDDEESLAILGKEMLTHLGYTVVTCTASTEALNTFQEAPQRFDLVITDHTMPFMTGFELARKLLEIRTDIPIILATGFSPMITPERVKEIGIREFILKPIAIKDLAQIIRKVLDRKE